jgi:hypothetical protein
VKEEVIINTLRIGKKKDGPFELIYEDCTSNINGGDDYVL